MIIEHMGLCIEKAGRIIVQIIEEFKVGNINRETVERLIAEVKDTAPDCEYFKYLHYDTTCKASISDGFN